VIDRSRQYWRRRKVDRLYAVHVEQMPTYRTGLAYSNVRVRHQQAQQSDLGRFDANKPQSLSGVAKHSLEFCSPLLCATPVFEVAPVRSANNQIRAVREAQELSLETLATLVGTTNQQISLLETGKRRLTVEWLIRLAKALSCHPWTLVADDLPKQMRPEDLRLLDRFRRMTGSQQTELLRFLETIIPPSRPRRSKTQR